MSQPNPGAAKQQQQPEQEDFSWLSPPPSLESTQDKFLRKFKENPAVPLGVWHCNKMVHKYMILLLFSYYNQGVVSNMNLHS